MHIGTRVSSITKPVRDGVVVDVKNGCLCVVWDKDKQRQLVSRDDVRMIGFDPSYDSGVGVIRDGVSVWKKVVIHSAA